MAKRRDRRPDLTALGNWVEFWNNKLTGPDVKDVPDRVIVIMAAAYLEEQLDQVLRGFFVDAEKEADELLQPDKAIGGFTAKARLAYCLGLLWEEWYQDLK